MEVKNSFVKKVEKTIQHYKMLQRGDKVLVAVSGGPDSVALLHTLNLLKDKFEIKLIVGHINHQLRAEESDKDEKFVKALSEKLNLKFFSKSIEVRKTAEKKKMSIEDCARQMRYSALESIANKIKADKIALGHNLDDQAETILLRLIRGSGPLGLCGIPAIRGKLIRPLIQTKREEIENFLKDNLWEWRVDWSNFNMDYLRNRVRLKLLSLIKKEFNPNIVEVLARTAQLLTEEKDYLTNQIEKAFRNAVSSQSNEKIVLDLKKMIVYDIYLKTNVIRLAFNRLSGDSDFPSFSIVQRAIGLLEERKAGKRVELDKNIWAEVSSDALIIYKSRKPAKAHWVKLPGKLEIDKLKLKSEVIPRPKLPRKIKSNSPWVAYLDWDKLSSPFGLRHRKNKDWFIPLGLKGSKTLADFLIDLKVPRMERDDIFLLTSKNRIAWVVGQRIDDRFKIDSNTKEVLKIEAFLEN
ncbi:MAG: tRNA lysidine(34) synthetase TilS [candidate division Zixibacteria bacterium]|nr:tRNA lysidine(34) synthetase TilS [candidate division Zixibacteria bacterium]